MNGTVKFITLGCKVNQYETQAMREAAARAGLEPVGQRAQAGREIDFVVINTCTVTADADHNNKYWIRRARREHPGARIVVTGCMVTRDRAALEALPEVDLVLSNHEKAEIAERLLQSCADPGADAPGLQTIAVAPGRESRTDRHRYTPLSISEAEGNGRAFVKIQDGCNHACSFCKVVLARGRSRSRAVADIAAEAARLADSGYREVVLAGIQLGAYGLDFGMEAAAGLREVMEACAKVPGISRIRLSSIEPTDIRPRLIEAMRDIPQCVPHLHVPLQSGDDEILARMNRRYGRAFYLDLAARLYAELPDFSLTLDVMAGFPGEEETHFQNTVDLLEKVRPLKCHVFPYSPREGTRAALLANVPAERIRERVNTLMALGERLGHGVREPYAGREMTVLVESRLKKTPLLQGLTANYLKVCFQGEPAWVGRLVNVRLLAVQGDMFLGKAVE